MKKNLPLFCLFLALSLGMSAQAVLDGTRVSTELLIRLAQDPSEYQDVMLLFEDRVDVETMNQTFIRRRTPVDERARAVVWALKNKAAATQGPLLALLEGLPGVEPGSVTPYWITNAIQLRANQDALAVLSNRTELEWIDWVAPEVLDKATASPLSPAEIQSPNGREVGHDVINAPDMWRLGYTGYARKAYVVDSGVDWTHPAIAGAFYGNYAPLSQAWFSNVANQTPYDCDNDVHGSHVAGTILGLNPATNDTVGVAPGGLWMGSPAIGCGPVNSTSALQWALDPDNNPNTTDDLPDVINNSWGSPSASGTECTGVQRDVLVALDAAGVAVVFSAGNEGPGVSTMSSPKNINVDTVNVFSVAMINANAFGYPVNPGSSRGPSLCPAPAGTLLIKPEVSAPGVNVRSLGPNGSYQSLTGTSMASPHVSGAILLLKEAFPYLSGRDLKLALFYTAVDLGTPGEDNDYGMGLIDVFAAYNYLVARGNVPVQVSRAVDVEVESILNLPALTCNPSLLPFVVLKNKGTQNLTSAKVVYSYGNGTSDTLNWTGVIPPAGSQPVILPSSVLPAGRYTLSIEAIEANGQADYFFLNNTKSTTFTISADEKPVTAGAVACAGSQVALTAAVTSGDIKWFTAPSGGTAVASGDVFLTPAISANTTYYAAQINERKLGKADNVSDLGGFEQSLANYLVFDAIVPFTLKSVKVYSNVAGVRVIVLRNASGTILQTAAVNIGTGEVRVPINFNIPAGTNYQLGLAVGGLSGLYRSLSNVVYPYLIPGVAEIKRSNTDNDVLKFYYFFYDWEVSYEGICGRSAAAITLGAGAATASFSPSATVINLQSNPAVTFTDQSTGAASWLWNFGDGTTSTQQSPVHTFLTPGDYLVSLTVTSANGCVDADTITISAEGFPVSIDRDQLFKGRWDVLPNQSEGRFAVHYRFESAGTANWQVTDVTGKLVRSGALAGASEGVMNLDLTGVAAGWYTLRVISGDGQATRKLEVLR